MANEQQAFFVDDELIERLLRGDTAPAAGKKRRGPPIRRRLGDAIQQANNASGTTPRRR